MHVDGILTVLLVGLVAGFLANMVAGGGGGGLIGNIIVGLIGSLVGSFLASFLNIHFYGFWGSVIISTCGAILLLYIFGSVSRRRLD